MLFTPFVILLSLQRFGRKRNMTCKACSNLYFDIFVQDIQSLPIKLNARVYVHMCVYLHLSGHISFSFKLTEKLHQNPSRGSCS